MTRVEVTLVILSRLCIPTAKNMPSCMMLTLLIWEEILSLEPLQPLTARCFVGFSSKPQTVSHRESSILNAFLDQILMWVHCLMCSGFKRGWNITLLTHLLGAGTLKIRNSTNTERVPKDVGCKFKRNHENISSTNHNCLFFVSEK